MDNLWLILVQFILRVTFGVSLAMAVTPARKVTSGYYRVHLWVLMGMNTFAALALFTASETFIKVLGTASLAKIVLGLTIFLAVASYIGAVIWLYEKSALGNKLLYFIAALALTSATLATPWSSDASFSQSSLRFMAVLSSGLLLGTTLAAMFLGHWYLNTPTMELVPLKRLVVFMVIAVALRSLLCGVGLAGEILNGNMLTFSTGAFIVMRWAAGLVGVFAMAAMAWQTLKIPNTQSATGILYAGVILAFIGELTSQLLSVGSLYPL